MASEKQNKKERFYLDAFLNCVGIGAENIRRGDQPPHQSPDFVFMVASNVINLEMTEFHREPEAGSFTRRQVEEEWRQVQRLFRQERQKYPALDEVAGKVYFQQMCVPPDKEQGAFVDELFKFASRILNALDREQRTFCSFDDEYPLLNRHLDKIVLRRAGCYVTWGWNFDVAWIGLTEDELLRAIRPKLGAKPHEDTDEFWLLVVSGPHLSQSMGIPSVEEMRGWQRTNADLAVGPYHAVYIFQYMLDQVLLWRRRDGWREETKAKFAR